MPVNASSNNPLYIAYHAAGPTAALIVPAALLNLVTISGVIMNSFVLLVTLITKSLHGTANFLLAMISLFEVLHQTGHTIFLVIQVSGINFVSFIDAVRMELVMLFGLNSSLCAIACAAFDRLFAVLSQHTHRRLKKPIYLFAHICVCACFGALSTLYVYQYYANDDPDSPTTGCIAEVLSGPVGELFFKITAVVNAICALFYLLVWIVIRCKKGVTKETHGRLLKSLVLILVVNIGGYFINLGTYQILFHLPPNLFPPITVWHIGFIAGILLNMGAGSNAIILYFNSTEYRKAFRRVLHKGFIALGSSPTGADRVFHVNSNNQINPSGGPSRSNATRTGPSPNRTTK